MKSFFLFLAKTPWLGRQITKLTGYVGALLVPLLAKAKVSVDGQVIDIFTDNQEVAILAGVLAVLAGLLELGMSYGKHILSGQSKGGKPPVYPAMLILALGAFLSLGLTSCGTLDRFPLPRVELSPDRPCGRIVGIGPFDLTICAKVSRTNPIGLENEPSPFVEPPLEIPEPIAVGK